MKKILITMLAFMAMKGQCQELLWQKCNESLPSVERIKPVRCSDNNHQSDSRMDYSVDLTVDDDFTTNYHTLFYPEHIKVSPENPADLIYEFEDVERIDDMDYVPRQDIGVNGIVTEAEIYVKTASDNDYRLYQHCQWALDKNYKRVHFEGGLLRPTSIKVRFLAGYGGHASCAQMLFLVKGKDLIETDIFADDLLTSLKPGTTKTDIEKIEEPIIHQLAQELLDGTYQTDYRVATYDCFNSPQWLSSQWRTPDKYYDQFQGVTGIVMEPGKHLVVVSGLPDSIKADLKVVAWYTGVTGRNFDGNHPSISSFSLHNGPNVIDYIIPWTGLAYISYFSEGYADANPPIRVHFVGGTVNGYLTPDMTNEQMHKMTAQAPSRFIDVVSKKVHAVWTAAGMHEFCKAEDGKSPGYRQYMNILDTLMTWEQRLVGFEKYNRIPKNRTLFYVNFVFSVLYQDQLGISTHVDNERKYLNCRTILHDDSDAIWGMSHEWGHQHQLRPFFCWVGLTEVTNNLASYYNLMHIGYKYEELDPSKRDGIENGIKHYLEDETDDCLFEVSTIYDHAFERLGPFLRLCNYFMNEGGKPDFLPDLYETLRHSEVTPDSTNVVPYVLNFIRTASTVSGYNLLPYFERFGFLRVKEFEIIDYTKAFYRLSQEELDIFRKEMKVFARKKKLKTMPEGMVERIAHAPDIEYDKPHFEN